MSKAYRSDMASCELRKERCAAKLCSAFEYPDEVDGPAGSGDIEECSIKELKHILRSLGVKEQAIVNCVEKSDLKNLLTLTPEVSTTAEDVENRLFHTQSGDTMRKPAMISPKSSGI